MNPQIDNNTKTWDNLMVQLRTAVETLQKNEATKEFSNALKVVCEGVFVEMRKTLDENAQLKEKLDDSILLDISEDDNQQNIGYVRRLSTFEQNPNLIGLSSGLKKKKLNNDASINENLLRREEKESLAEKLREYNDFIPTTQMSDVALARVVKLLEAFQYPKSEKGRLGSSYTFPIFKMGDCIITHLELLKVFLVNNFRKEEDAFYEVFRSLAEIPHLKIWASNEMMTVQPCWRRTVKMVVDRIIDKNSAKEAVTNLLRLEWGVSEKSENFISRYVRDITNANQTESGWPFLTETLYKAMDTYHKDERRSLQQILSLALNEQRNIEHIKDMFLEIAATWRNRDRNLDKPEGKKLSSTIRCRFCGKRGHMEKDCRKKVGISKGEDKKLRCQHCHSRDVRWGFNHDFVDCRYKNRNKNACEKCAKSGGKMHHLQKIHHPHILF